MARGQDQRKKHPSKVKQHNRWVLNEKNDYETYYLPYTIDLLMALSKSGLSDPMRLDKLLLATCMAYVICYDKFIYRSKCGLYSL